MVGVAIFDNTEGEGHPMLGIVAINHEHMERWHACVSMQEKKNTCGVVDMGTQACRWVACACDVD